MWRLVLRILVVVFVSMTCALVVNALRFDTNAKGASNRLALITPPKETLDPKDEVSLAEARKIWDTRLGEVFFLDARAPADYRAGHIAAARNLPWGSFEEQLPVVQPMLTPNTPIIVYCDGEECDLSHQVLKRLKALGYKDVRVLVNGWTLWRQAGYPTATGAES
jgi:rhodanese-related sulfurtransferase